MSNNTKRHIKIFNRWLKENHLYFKYRNETKQKCRYLKKQPYSTEKYIMQRLNEERVGGTFAIITLTVNWRNLIYDFDMWKYAAAKWADYCNTNSLK